MLLCRVLTKARMYWKVTSMMTDSAGITKLYFSPSTRTTSSMSPVAVIAATEAVSYPLEGSTLKDTVRPAMLSETLGCTTPPAWAEGMTSKVSAEVLRSEATSPAMASGSPSVPEAVVGKATMETQRTAMKTSIGSVTVCFFMAAAPNI